MCSIVKGFYIGQKEEGKIGYPNFTLFKKTGKGTKVKYTISQGKSMGLRK